MSTTTNLKKPLTPLANVNKTETRNRPVTAIALKESILYIGTALPGTPLEEDCLPGVYRIDFAEERAFVFLNSGVTCPAPHAAAADMSITLGAREEEEDRRWTERGAEVQ